MGLLSSRQLKNNIELSMIPSLGRQVTLRFILDIFYGKMDYESMDPKYNLLYYKYFSQIYCGSEVMTTKI